MIGGFRDRRTEAFFAGYPVPAFRAFNRQAVRRMTILDHASSLRELRALRSNRLAALSGDRTGEYSIRINRQWRVCFRWGEEGPYDVQIVDYH